MALSAQVRECVQEVMRLTLDRAVMCMRAARVYACAGGDEPRRGWQ